jgi:hypothetical protein
MSAGVSISAARKGEGRGRVWVYHSVAGELGVSFQDAVCGRVVACCVHGVGACLVQGGWEPHIAGVPARDGDFWHGGGGGAVLLLTL